MGKHFYGTHPDKNTAIRLANYYARNYKKCVCFTPASENTCTFDSNTNMWSCLSRAHHNEGSCGTWEIHPRRGDEWSIPPIQVWPLPEIPSFPGNTPPVILPDPDKPNQSPLDKAFFKSVNNNQETYEDAPLEDYESL